MRGAADVFLRLCGDRRGSNAVEVAIIAPILTTLMFCGVDIANGFSTRLALEQAAGRTVELALASGKVKSNYTYLIDEAVAASGQPAANVTVANWLECDGVRSSSFAGTCASGAQIARYVSVSISRLYKPTFNWMGQFISTQTDRTTVLVVGDATVRVQ